MNTESVHNRYYNEFLKTVRDVTVEVLRQIMHELTKLNWENSEIHDMACAWSLAQTGDAVVSELVALSSSEIQGAIAKHWREKDDSQEGTAVRGEGEQAAEGTDGVLSGRDQAGTRRDQRGSKSSAGRQLPESNADSTDGHGSHAPQQSLYGAWASRLSKRVPVELIKVAEAAQDRRRNEDLVQAHKETVRKATNSPRLQVKRIANLDDAEKRLARAKYKLDYCLDELESKIRIHSKEGL